jgi:hypothetical protein
VLLLAAKCGKCRQLPFEDLVGEVDLAHTSKQRSSKGESVHDVPPQSRTGRHGRCCQRWKQARQCAIQFALSGMALRSSFGACTERARQPGAPQKSSSAVPTDAPAGRESSMCTAAAGADDAAVFVVAPPAAVAAAAAAEGTGGAAAPICATVSFIFCVTYWRIVESGCCCPSASMKERHSARQHTHTRRTRHRRHTAQSVAERSVAPRSPPHLGRGT